MPKHPFIKKPLYDVVPTMRYDMRFGQFHDGPVAGKQRQFDGTFIVEVSDRTFKGMLDHKVRWWTGSCTSHHRTRLTYVWAPPHARTHQNKQMGGKTIVPGMFFVEQALEASHTFPVTLANVEFKSMLRIPVASKGEQALLCGLAFQDVKVSSVVGRWFVCTHPRHAIHN